jgi:predicted RecB family nuclease
MVESTVSRSSVEFTAWDTSPSAPNSLLRGSGFAGERRRLLLEAFGVVLAQLQGNRPEQGGVLDARGRILTLPLSKGLKRGERLLNALSAMQLNAKGPPLVLNTHCQICEFQNRCRAQALEEDNLSLLRGISEGEITKLNRKGIFTINQLSYTFRPRRIKKRAKNPAHSHYFALQARALREHKVFVHGSPKLDVQDTRIYLDIEGVPADHSYYLVGLVIDQSGALDQKSFWADDKNHELSLFMEVLNHIKQYQKYTLLHYGAYEVRALRNVQRRLPTEYANQIEHVLKQAVNVLSVITPFIYFPVYSNSLKDIAGYLGHKWSVDSPSGAHALLWRREWHESRDDQLKQRLIQYNIEDCLALKLVTEFIEQVVQHPTEPPHNEATFLHTDHFEKEARQHRTFQRKEFALEEFDFINRCSYFDYQRDKMSTRRKRPPPARAASQRLRTPRVYKSNKVIEMVSSRCPMCRSRMLRSLRSLNRQIVDLKFSGAAVRRWVVLYRSKEYRCNKCNREFVPDGFPTIRSKFGTGLISWCMYQMIVGGQNMARIRLGLAKLFGLDIDRPSVYRFKETISYHYTHLYNEIFKTLLGSPVLYIDETVANLRSESGYVWCMTDGQSVFYFYKGSREGSFLPEMLKDFRGVLVSDFFTAYDSIPCRQQRCLVHMMRDLNEEMHKHPFDAELRLLAVEFSTVLKRAVETIDAYGFKERHLRKHKSMAREFCQWASDNEFDSPPAERLRARIVKYQERLFTFLDYDGVSWNNNNAEYFIKPFAQCRRTANGRFTVRSIQDYLVILSAAQTCRGKGRDFLQFLLDDNRHRFNFRSGRRASIEREQLAASALPSLGP